jgi:hypothetical protein
MHTGRRENMFMPEKRDLERVRRRRRGKGAEESIAARGLDIMRTAVRPLRGGGLQ